MQKKLAKLYPLFIVGLLPAMSVMAASITAGATNVDQLINQFKTTLNLVIVLLFILESIFLIIGVMKIIIGGAEAQKSGKTYILYSIIAMAVSIGAWALARILIVYFIGSGTDVAPPTTL